MKKLLLCLFSLSCVFSLVACSVESEAAPEKENLTEPIVMLEWPEDCIAQLMNYKGSNSMTLDSEETAQIISLYNKALQEEPIEFSGSSSCVYRYGELKGYAIYNSYCIRLSTETETELYSFVMLKDKATDEIGYYLWYRTPDLANNVFYPISIDDFKVVALMYNQLNNNTNS